MLVTIYIQFIGLLVPSSADVVLCLMPLLCLASQGVVAACSSCAGLFWFYSYFAVSTCPLVWAFAATFIQCIFHNACWDSLSALMHAGIVCLTFLTCDWSWLHVGIVCLASLACDCATASWDSMSSFLAMIG